jgi:hypothetical protein
MSSVTATAISTIAVNASVERGMKVACLDVSNQVVQALAARYGFDAEEALRILSLEAVSVARAPGAKRAAGEKKPKAAKASRMVPEIPLPFCGAKAEWCSAIRLNHGLYTQCTNEISEAAVYCKTCQKQADANANGKPNFGTIGDRVSVDPMEYVDPHGRKVVPYSAVMSKLKIERSAAEAEATRFGWTIDETQFEAAAQKKRGRPKSASNSDNESEKVKKSRGRPRKNKEVGAATNVADDLLAAMLEQAKINDSEDAQSQESESESEDEVDAEAEAAKAKAKADAEAAKEAEKAAKKAAKEAEKEAAKAAKAAEKAAEKEAAKAAKAAEKEAAKAAKAAEKEAAKAAKAGEKKAAKPAKKQEVVAQAPAEVVVEAVAAPAAAAAADAELSEEEVEEEEEEEQLVLRRKTHKGKNYYVCEKNNIYDPETQEIIGAWNAETNAPELD